MTLDEEIREALGSEAAGVEAPPEAWDQLVARLGRRQRSIGREHRFESFAFQQFDDRELERHQVDKLVELSDLRCLERACPLGRLRRGEPKLRILRNRAGQEVEQHGVAGGHMRGAEAAGKSVALETIVDAIVAIEERARSAGGNQFGLIAAQGAFGDQPLGERSRAVQEKFFAGNAQKAYRWKIQ